jgi:hypothetical protein
VFVCNQRLAQIHALDAHLVVNAAHALHERAGTWPSDGVGRTVCRLVGQPYATIKMADYILVGGFERPDIFETVASGTAWP